MLILYAFIIVQLLFFRIRFRVANENHSISFYSSLFFFSINASLECYFSYINVKAIASRQIRTQWPEFSYEINGNFLYQRVIKFIEFIFCSNSLFSFIYSLSRRCASGFSWTAENSDNFRSYCINFLNECNYDWTFCLSEFFDEITAMPVHFTLPALVEILPTNIVKIFYYNTLLILFCGYLGFRFGKS